MLKVQGFTGMVQRFRVQGSRFGGIAALGSINILMNTGVEHVAVFTARIL